MILTVTPNPALDVTYRVAGLTVDAVNRVAGTDARAGGKGINVARVLHALGVPATALGFAGGRDGDALRAGLDARGIAHDLVATRGETRRTVAVVDPAAGTVTLLNEPGPVITESEWTALRDRVESRLPGASVLVLSGSLPRGLPDDAYAMLVRQAERHGVPVVLDADGVALRQAVPAGPRVVKPNAAELAGATGLPGLEAGARLLRRDGAHAVVVSDGPRGLYADTPDGSWRAVPPRVVGGNPTGAGDAAVAALAVGLAEGWDWPRTLAHAAALSAAAATAPLAGQVELAAYHDNLGRVSLRAGEEAPQCR
ncbi:1-phosphofructokinase family hexose kinase [Thermoactinospora rubra]|uniref:1-phosphofructokinase family hexose kinase n=1 Tax=Thermoactinospora rubra TaxID=1088767 RepID=UPI000A120084|nr:1-phosphofructokinase family hexose kinase [Thermoactinospora rubra]